MGQVFHAITRSQIEETIVALLGAIEGMREAASKMQEAGMDSAYFPWTDRQWSAQDVIATLGDECRTKIQSQVNAFKQGRPSEYAKTKERSKKTVAARKVKKQTAKPKE